jgi:hypothetical protein
MDKRKGYVLLLMNAGVRSSVSERKKSRRYFGLLSHNFPLPPMFQTTSYGPELDLKQYMQSVPITTSTG